MTRRALGRRLFGTLAVAMTLLVGGGDVLAVVGMPATPVSYAGVARRTTRRTARRTVAREAAAAATTVVLLPAGCPRVTGASGALYTCGGYYYRPTYDGPNLVYVVSNSP